MALSIARPDVPRRAPLRPATLVLGGVEVRGDISCLFAVGLGAWTFADTVMPEAAAGRPAAAYWAAGLAAAALLLGSLAVHEAGHCLAARRAGLLPRRIALSLFGGVTVFDREAAAPPPRVALAGPLASLAVAAVAAVAHVALTEAGADPLVAAVAAVVSVANLAIAGLNLVPALPLDGGHVLRAAVAAASRRPELGWMVALGAGRLLGGGLLATSILASAAGDAALAVWAAMLGLVVYDHARAARPDRLLTARPADRSGARPRPARRRAA